MKKSFTLFVTVFFTLVLVAQSPQEMSYQAVIRNASNGLVTSSPVGMRVSILQGSPTGTEVYKEIYNPNPQTNANGLVTIQIGGGIPLTGTFAGIDWSAGPYYIKTETDPTGGTNYTITGTSQLLSVPYALYAKTVASYTETDPIVKAINGIVKSNGTTISTAMAGTDYLMPNGSAALLTNFPILNQNTTGSAASFTGSLAGDVTGTQVATVVGNSAVLSKVLTGYVSGAGTVAATDNILQAIEKLNGNNPMHYIGESYGGGIVFYVYDNGQHGLIAATADQSTSLRWYAGTFTYTMALADGIGAGKANTAIIIANQGYGDGATYAARICNEYSVTVGGVTYGDWYLPSKYELNLLYLQKAVVGGFNNGWYWSSTETNNYSAWLQIFGSGTQDYNGKNYYYSGRAIRGF
jgi:Protein of unknown function (DUF1566)